MRIKVTTQTGLAEHRATIHETMTGENYRAMVALAWPIKTRPAKGTGGEPAVVGVAPMRGMSHRGPKPDLSWVKWAPALTTIAAPRLRKA